MKKSFLGFVVLLITSAMAYNFYIKKQKNHDTYKCFIACEKGKIIYQEGDCNKRFAPCSTFKIALSLIGYDSGILVDEINPTWAFQEGYADFIEKWKQDHTPTDWMKNSCVWYSQVLTKQLGMEKFKLYVNKLTYGNMDLTGDKGQSNGLTNSWLSSSLEISSFEQIEFLNKLIDGVLPVSDHAHKMTRNILFLEELPNGWKLYGKTGSGRLLDKNGNKTEIQHGWFIGWIEKNERKIIFSNHITDSKKEDSFASLRAKADAKERLKGIIDTIGNSHES